MIKRKLLAFKYYFSENISLDQILNPDTYFSSARQVRTPKNLIRFPFQGQQ